MALVKEALSWASMSVCSGSVDPTTAANGYRVTIFANWEYTTEIPALGAEPSPVDVAAYAAAEAIMINVPMATCNPFHWSMIKEYMKKGIRHLPTLIKTLELAQPFVSAIL